MKTLKKTLESLEKEWSSIKQQLPNPNPGKTSSIAILECSPRRLMTSLQHEINHHDVADDDVIRRGIRRFAGIKGRRLQFEEDEVVSEVCSSGSCLDVVNESVGNGGRSRWRKIVRVCIFVALVACVLGGLRFRVCSFGVGEEHMILVPT